MTACEKSRPVRGIAGNSSRKYATAILLVFLFLAGVPGAGARQDGEKQGRLSLGADKGARGDDAFIPVVFSPAPGARIQNVTAEIRFPNRSLAFQEVKSSGSPDSGNIDLRAEVVPATESPESSLVRLRVESKGAEGIQSGAVATLIFRVLDGAAVGDTIKLQTRAEAVALNGPAGAATPLLTNSGEIEIVQVPALFACFFYMH